MQSVPLGEILFSGDTDYIKGLNSMWFAARSTEAMVYGACLLPSSYQVVLETSGAETFVKTFNELLGFAGTMPAASFFALKDPDSDGGQELAENVIYVCRQCKLQLGVDSVMSYLWSTAKFVFNLKVFEKVYTAQDLTFETRMTYLPYPNVLPENWLMDGRYLVVPDKSVFAVDVLEGMFGSMGRYLSMINNPSAFEKELMEDKGLDLLTKFYLYLLH